MHYSIQSIAYIILFCLLEIVKFYEAISDKSSGKNIIKLKIFCLESEESALNFRRIDSYGLKNRLLLSEESTLIGEISDMVRLTGKESEFAALASVSSVGL